VLVIDDSKTIRRTAETLLQGGCTVYTAVDGFDALAKIADYRPTSSSWTS
jgi:twitching motility two-component system response regulator PilG